MADSSIHKPKAIQKKLMTMTSANESQNWAKWAEAICPRMLAKLTECEREGLHLLLKIVFKKGIRTGAIHAVDCREMLN